MVLWLANGRMQQVCERMAAFVESVQRTTMNNDERQRSLMFVDVRRCSLAFAENYGRSRDSGVPEERPLPGRDHRENHPGLCIIVVALSGGRSSRSRGAIQDR